MFYARKVANKQQIDYNMKMETYQRGRTEPHSKCGCREIGTWVQIPPSPPINSRLNLIRVWTTFFLLSNKISLSTSGYSLS